MAQIIPEDYKTNPKGHLVPIDSITEFDLLQDEIAVKLAQQAKELQRYMREVKENMFTQMAEVLAKSKDEDGKQKGGVKGNFSIYSYDGRIKVSVATADRVVFDARLADAKVLIDECLNEWTAQSGNNNLRAIVTEAFETDKEGHISHSKIADLCRTKIDDPRWEEAMKIIATSRQVIGTASYVRAYERDETGKFQLINLDIAKV